MDHDATSETLVKNPLIGALLVAIAAFLTPAGPSAAAVTYTFEGGIGDFHGGLFPLGAFAFVSPDFITYDRITPLADLSSCSVYVPASDCADQQFYRLPDRDLVDFRFRQIGFNVVNTVFTFEPGAFGSLGLHLTPRDNGYVGRLTITGFSERSSTPEPAAWALLILGFGGIGIVMRCGRDPRRGATRAEPIPG